MQHRFTYRRAFTLIEIMIVVVLLGILAAIVLICFGDQIVETKEVAVKGDLRVMRTQITTYQVQHANTLPPTDRLVEALGAPTDLDGNPVSSASTLHFGPYLTYVPPNPINNLNTIKVIPAGAELAPDDSSGWLYQSDSGTFKLIANTTKLDMRGRPIAEY